MATVALVIVILCLGAAMYHVIHGVIADKAEKASDKRCQDFSMKRKR